MLRPEYCPLHLRLQPESSYCVILPLKHNWKFMRLLWRFNISFKNAFVISYSVLAEMWSKFFLPPPSRPPFHFHCISFFFSFSFCHFVIFFLRPSPPVCLREYSIGHCGGCSCILSFPANGRAACLTRRNKQICRRSTGLFFFFLFFFSPSSDAVFWMLTEC